MILWKQYLRMLPAHLGLINKGAYLYQIDAILADDLFIVSYPKSGNTWLRFIVASFFHPLEKINNRSIDLLVPDVYRNKREINTQKNKRIIKSHDTYFQYHPYTVYIVRDYRDVAVSFFYYMRAQEEWKHMSMDEFLKSDRLKKPFGSWADHTERAVAFQKKNPERILMVKYEDLVRRDPQVIASLFNFCKGKIALPDETLYTAFSIEKLKQDEAIYGNYFTDHTANSFFRKGEPGDWKKQLNDKQVNVLLSDEATKKMMLYFNYLQ